MKKNFTQKGQAKLLKNILQREEFKCCDTGGGGDTFVLHIQDTVTLDLSGNGSAFTPLKGDVKVSNRPNNLLTIASDGLFAGAPNFSIFARNGVNMLAGNVELGGPLLHDTTIDTENGALFITNLIPDDTITNIVAITDAGQLVVRQIPVPVVSANNGVNTDNGPVQLGGQLIQGTEIGLNGHGFLIDQFSGGVNMSFSMGPVSIPDPTISMEVAQGAFDANFRMSQLEYQISLAGAAGFSSIMTIQTGSLGWNGSQPTQNIDTAFTFTNENQSGNRIAKFQFDSIDHSVSTSARVQIIGVDESIPATGQIWLQTNTGTGYKGLKVLSTHDFVFENYLSGRNDGNTVKALYVDVSGNVKYGPISTGISGTFTSQDGKTITVTGGLITSIV